MRIEARAHRRSAERQRIQPVTCRFDDFASIIELRDPAGDNLAERDRRRVHQVRAADHHDVGKGVRLGSQRVAQCAHCRQELLVYQVDRRDVHHRRKRVVRRLPAVDIIVRMDRFLRADYAARQLNRTVGDHLVRVHVRLRAGPGLEHDERKLGVQTTVDDLLRRAHDQRHLVGGQLAERAVGLSRAFLENPERANNRPSPAKPVDADRKVVDRALRLRAPQTIGRDADFAERVLLHTVGFHKKYATPSA